MYLFNSSKSIIPHPCIFGLVQDNPLHTKLGFNHYMRGVKGYLNIGIAGGRPDDIVVGAGTGDGGLWYPDIEMEEASCSVLFSVSLWIDKTQIKENKLYNL